MDASFIYCTSPQCWESVNTVIQTRENVYKYNFKKKWGGGHVIFSFKKCRAYNNSPNKESRKSLLSLLLFKVFILLEENKDK